MTMTPAAKAASAEAFENTFHKVRAEVSRDWWDRIWAKAADWAWSCTPTGAAVRALVAEGVVLPLATPDVVNHPSHYTAGKVECIDALEAATTGLQGIEAVCTANAIKYLWRWKQKNGQEDLRKARWYINRLLGEEAKA